METEEVISEKVYASSRPPPKISMKHLMRELGSEVAQRPQAAQVIQQPKSAPSIQQNPSPDHDDRTGQPAVGDDPRTAPGAIPGRSKHVHLMTAKASTLKIKQNMIERGLRKSHSR